MHSTLHSSALALASIFALAPAGAAATAVPTELSTATAVVPTEAASPAETSIFGAPLFVNGKRITDNQIKLYLIYGPCHLMVDSVRITLIMEEEIKRAAAEATEVEMRKREAEKPFATPADRQKAFDAELVRQLDLNRERAKVSDEEFDEDFAKTLEDFKKKYPVLNLQNEIVRAYRSLDWYKLELRQAMRFDKVFLPNNPDEWPIVSIEAVLADSGEGMLEDAKQGYQMRKQWAANHDETKIPHEDTLYANVLRQIVRDAMYNLIDFRTSTEGLSDDVALWADTNGDGQPEVVVKTDEMWAQIKDHVSELDLDRAKAWLAKSAATRDRLKAMGHLLNDEECRAVLAELQKPLEGTHITLGLSATEMHYFPSLQAYKEFQFMLAGFTRSMEPELAVEGDPSASGTPKVSAALRQHLDRANKMLGLGEVDLEALLVSAWDYPKGQWKPDGWKWAEQRSKELKAQVDDYVKKLAAEEARKAEATKKGEEYKSAEPMLSFYRWWTQMMDDHSEYWDPPPPEGPGVKQSMIGYKMKGRFTPRYRNDLIGVLEESEFTEWVAGGSITDHTFFDQEVGTVDGPFKGPRGYYLTYVKKRNPPTQPLLLTNERHRALLREDFLRTKFIDFGKEALAKADVKGL